ncbi:MAG: glycosyltransferase family 39 protein [Aridibacter famidurans]|nr:glycosyltransferase family 39 protein [Aridibacter famidurans]
MGPLSSADEGQEIQDLRPAIPYGVSREAVFLTVSAVVAFLVRLFMIPADAAVTSDGAYYATLGEKLLSSDFGNGFSAYWPPFYPFLIGLFSFVSPDSEFAGRLVSILAGTALIFPVFVLIRDFYGPRAAVLGVILTIFHPFLVEASGWVLAESLYILLLTAGLLMSWRSLQSGKPLLFFSSGLLFGLAYLTKPEAVAYVGLVIVFVAIAKVFRWETQLRTLGKGYALFLAGFLIFLIPYVLVIHQMTGNWTLTDKFQGNVAAVDSDMGPLDLTSDRSGTLKDRWMGSMYEVDEKAMSDSYQPAHPAPRDASFNLLAFAKIALEELRHQIRVYVPEMLRYPLIIAAIVGFFYRPFTRSRFEKELFLSSFVFCTLLLYAMSVIELRYLFVIIPVLIFWASNGLVELSDWIEKSAANLFARNAVFRPAFVQALLLLIALGFYLDTAFFGNPILDLERSREDKKAGVWIRENTASAPSLIMGPSPVAAFYAKADSIYLPNEKFTEVIDYARRKGVDYIYVNERLMSGTPKLVIPDAPHLPDDLKVVFREDLGGEDELYVLELSDE